MKKFINKYDEDGNLISIGVKAETKKAKLAIKVITKPTKSKHTVDPNTKAAQAAINNLKKPTSSIHTVYEKVVQTHATGGLVRDHLQKFGSGGTFTGSGRVPGNDPYDSDGINAVLTAGEYVIKRASVNILGSDVLNRLNNNPRSLTSSGAGVASASQVPLQPVKIYIGEKVINAKMTPTEVMDALQIGIEQQGGY